MSYKGHSQCICLDGHYFIKDCYDSNEEFCHISNCKAPIAMNNMVDDTNGESNGLILDKDLAKFIVHRPEICTCECGHKHLRVPTLYRIPTPEEQQALRTINEGDGPLYIKDLTS